jgi:hypothetical protein
VLLLLLYKLYIIISYDFKTTDSKFFKSISSNKLVTGKKGMLAHKKRAALYLPAPGANYAAQTNLAATYSAFCTLDRFFGFQAHRQGTNIGSGSGIFYNRGYFFHCS